MQINPVILTERDNTLEIYKDATIECAGPGILLDADVCVIIGHGHTLTVHCTDSQQPCIGSRTHTGMSYGRWEYRPCECEKLILRDVNVILKSNVESFSIGAYGMSKMPEIVLDEGATLTAPDYGKPGYVRTLICEAKAPEGSTKISGLPIYAYSTKEHAFDSMPNVCRAARIICGDDADCDRLYTMCSYVSKNGISPEDAEMIIDYLPDPSVVWESFYKNKVVFVRACKEMGVDPDLVSDYLKDDSCCWKSNCIGDIVMSERLESVFSTINHVDNRTNVIREYVGTHINPSEVDAYTTYLWWMLPPTSPVLNENLSRKEKILKYYWG